MGVEFLSRTRPSIKKHVDRSRIKLATPDLLTRTPNEPVRCLTATLAEGKTVSPGEKLIVQNIKGMVSLRRGNETLGRFDKPSDDTVSSIDKAGGTACGQVAKVHKFSKKVEVALC